LNHEQQHQELFLTDIKHMLAQNPLCPVYAHASEEKLPALAPLRWRIFEEGTYSIGHEGDDFAFDNEGPRIAYFWKSLSSRRDSSRMANIWSS